MRDKGLKWFNILDYFIALEPHIPEDSKDYNSNKEATMKP